jgi:hypothetical protein
LQDTEIEKFVAHLRALVLGHLRRRGHLDDGGRLDPDAAADLDTLGTCHAAAIQGLIPFGERKGSRARLCDGATPRTTSSAAAQKKLCADAGGFSLHAAVRIGASQRDRLERICRYVARGPLAQDRLTLTRTGDVVYRFRHPWKNGKTAVVMDPMTFLSRLAAQVPPPRVHMVSYFGVLAAAAAKRESIVPGNQEQEDVRRTSSPGSNASPRPDCARRCRHLIHLGLPTEAPVRAPPRGVEQQVGFG